MLGSHIACRENLWRLLSSGAAIAAGIGAHYALKKAWKAVTREDPPLHPDAPGTDLDDALLWTVVSGIVIGLSRQAARRSTVALGDKQLKKYGRYVRG